MVMTIIIAAIALLSVVNFVFIVMIDKSIAKSGGKSIFWEEEKK